MKKSRLSTVGIALLIILWYTTGFFYAFGKEVHDDYFPLEVGYWWKYSVLEDGDSYLTRVTGKYHYGANTCYRYETFRQNKRTGGAAHYVLIPGRILLLVRESINPNSVRKLRIPQEYLRFPLEAGKNWEWREEYTTMGNVIVDHRMEVKGVESVTVPAGTFEGIRILYTARREGKNPVTKHLWFAPGVGLVKWTAQAQSSIETAVLTEYSLAGIPKKPQTYP